MYLRVANNTAGEPSWWLQGEHHERAASTGETFSSTSHATRAANAFKAGAATARCEIYAAARGNWQWRAKHSNDTVAISGESFATT
jgi:uncharacterized protein